MGYIFEQAAKYKQQGDTSIEAVIKIFADLKVVRFGDIRLLVDMVYLES